MTRVVALSGGVGGAKLAAGLAELLSPDELLIAVNTGDDFRHLGLTICPDIDSNVYALAGLHDRQRGWGRAGESWRCMAALEQLGGETWFQLGDTDLAMHLQRSERLRQGAFLSVVTGELARALDIRLPVVPMSDDPVQTVVVTQEGRLSFQDYFVRRRCEPAVRAIEYAGASNARVAPVLLKALRNPGLEAIIVCPSNPWLSIGPMLAMPALRAALVDSPVPVVAVSPIVGGQALKGPAAKIMQELGLQPGSAAIADYYQGMIDGLVIDQSDHNDQTAIAFRCTVHCTNTIMRGREDSVRLAEQVLDFARGISGRGETA